MKKLTSTQQEKIKRNLKAYLANFSAIKIVRVNNYFLVYNTKEFNKENPSNYYCSLSSIDEVNGFLIGMVKSKYNSENLEVRFNIEDKEIEETFIV